MLVHRLTTYLPDSVVDCSACRRNTKLFSERTRTLIDGLTNIYGNAIYDDTIHFLLNPLSKIMSDSESEPEESNPETRPIITSAICVRKNHNQLHYAKSLYESASICIS